VDDTELGGQDGFVGRHFWQSSKRVEKNEDFGLQRCFPVSSVSSNVGSGRGPAWGSGYDAVENGLLKMWAQVGR
jgi:hypothetical protein